MLCHVFYLVKAGSCDIIPIVHTFLSCILLLVRGRDLRLQLILPEGELNE